MQHLAGAPKTNVKEKQLKAPISILIVGKVKCEPKNTKQNQEGLIYAEDQTSQEIFDRSKHKSNNNPSVTCIAETVESSLRNRSMIG